MNRRYNGFTSSPMVWLIVFSAALFLASTASAVPPALTPGSTLYYNNTANNAADGMFAPNFYVSAPLPANFDTLLTSIDFPYNYNGTINNSFSGFVRSAVWQDHITKQLAFTYVLNNLAPPSANPPATDIVRATINDLTDPWGPFAIVAAGSDPNSGGHSTPINGFWGGWNNGVPFDVTRSGSDFGVAIEFNPLNSGTQLDFPSTNPLSNVTPPFGDRSALVWFATDATKFNTTNVSLSDNGHVGTGKAFSPNTVQGPFGGPEPSSLVLAALGGLGGTLALWRRRRLS
jgi:hypothetical protein